MDTKELEKMQDEFRANVIDKAKAVLDAVTIEVENGKPIIRNTFVMFSMINGNPQPVIGTGADPVILELMTKDYCKLLVFQQKADKIQATVVDPQMKQRLLKLLEEETLK